MICFSIFLFVISFAKTASAQCGPDGLCFFVSESESRPTPSEKEPRRRPAAIPHRWVKVARNRSRRPAGRKSPAQIVPKGPNKPETTVDETAYVFYGKGAAAIKNEEFDEAISNFSKAIEIRQDYMAAYHGRGLAYHRKGDLDNAFTDYSHAIRLKPTAITYTNRGILYYEKRKQDEAIRDYGEAIKLNPKAYGALYMRGLSYYLKKDYEAAISDFDECIRIDPENSQGYQGRAMTNDRNGHPELAAPDLQKIKELRKNN